jgi:hypothetical protein
MMMPGVCRQHQSAALTHSVYLPVFALSLKCADVDA